MNDPTEASEKPVLVVGYGNSLRSDDAVGRLIADEVAGWNLPHVRTLSVQQLTPDLAQVIAESRQAIFVDARSDDAAAEIAVLPLRAADSVGSMEHASNPRTLLALSRALYGTCPTAWWITVPVRNFEFGEDLSRQARVAMKSAVSAIADLVELK